jgi:hypothetical protein
MGLVTASGLFSGVFYESSLTNAMTITGSPSASSEAEQVQISIDIINSVRQILFWDWVKVYFNPLYSTDVATQHFVDELVIFLNLVSGFIFGIAAIEFVRNNLNVLGGG